MLVLDDWRRPGGGGWFGGLKVRCGGPGELCRNGVGPRKFNGAVRVQPWAQRINTDLGRGAVARLLIAGLNPQPFGRSNFQRGKTVFVTLIDALYEPGAIDHVSGNLRKPGNVVILEGEGNLWEFCSADKAVPSARMQAGRAFGAL